MSLDLDALSLHELIRLQDRVSQTMQRRFERPLAVGFSDIVGSTAYFSRFGNQAGRALLQRHIDMLEPILSPVGGRIVDTAGDGAFLCFPSADDAVQGLVALQLNLLRDNEPRPLEHQLQVRIGIHWGDVITDGQVVTGDAVNLCHRVAHTSEAGEIRMTRKAFLELSNQHRLPCRALRPQQLKGIPDPVEVHVYDWNDRNRLPSAVLVRETGQIIDLPDRDPISFGRLRTRNGQPANDVVLALRDPEQTRLISRWHFELRRGTDGFNLRQLSNNTTEVNQRTIDKGGEAPVHSGTVVSLSGVMTLTFLSGSGSDETMTPAPMHTGG